MRFDFLLCSERSGSNLITKILNAHPLICGPFPSHLLRSFTAAAWRYGDLRDDAHWDLFLHDAAYYMDNIFATWKSHLTYDDLRLRVQERSLAAVHRAFYEAEAAAHGKTRVFAKENHTYSFISYLLAHYPEARYVWLVRDPRDMALTWRQLASGGVRTATRVWLEDQRGSLRAYTWLRDIGAVHLLRFEDLLREPEKQVRAVCGFLGVGYTPEMLEFYRQDIVVQNAGRMVSWQDLRKPLQPENVGRYRQELSEPEIRYVEALCAPEMDYFGYARDFAERADPASLEPLLPEESAFDRQKTAVETEAYSRFGMANTRIGSRNVDQIAVRL